MKFLLIFETKIEILSVCYFPGTHGFSKKNVSPFGPAVWPALANISIYIHIYKTIYLQIYLIIIIIKNIVAFLLIDKNIHMREEL